MVLRRLLCAAALLLALPACDAPTTEGRNPGECADGEDNDGDDLVDCADDNCAGAPDCTGDGGGGDLTECAVIPSEGEGGVEGRQWIEVEGYGDGGPQWSLLVWGPPGTGDGEPRPVSMFVTRNLPVEEENMLGILEDFIGMHTMAEDSGMIAAVAVPGIITNNSRTWTGWAINNAEDEAFFVDALDTLEAWFNVDRSRVHIFGSHASGGYATHFAYQHADRIASTANQAGFNPFNPWPPTWLRPVSGMFIHDPRDEFQPESEIEDSALMFEAAGAYVERFYDLDSPALDGHHDWDSEDIWPRLTAFQADQCVPALWFQ